MEPSIRRPGWRRAAVRAAAWARALSLGLGAALHSMPADAAAPNGTPPFADVVEHFAPWVVRVEAIGVGSASARANGEGEGRVPPPAATKAVGAEATDALVTSGVLLADAGTPQSGWVVASLYQLEADPAAILVRLEGGERRSATIAGRDWLRRIVLLRTEPNGAAGPPVAAQLPPVGAWVVALGRTQSLDAPNASVGVVSAVGRIAGLAIQTDAKTSPANYGGPLVGLGGELVGVVTPLAPRGQDPGEWYDSGIGFAAPWSQISPRLEALRAGAEIRPGRLGVVLEAGDPFRVAPRIARVVAGGPAEQAGLRRGDTITSIGGAEVRSIHDFRRRAHGIEAGPPIELGISRRDARLRVVLTPDERPEEEPGAPAPLEGAPKNSPPAEP